MVTSRFTYQRQCELRVRFSTLEEIVKTHLSCYAPTLKNIAFKPYYVHNILDRTEHYNLQYITV